MKSDDLRTRIASAIESIRIQRDGDAAFMADAVIRELKLEALEFLARSWYRNYDIIPANDPRCPTDIDIAYDDAGMQILTALGLLND